MIDKKISSALVDFGLSPNNKGIEGYINDTPTFKAIKSIVEKEVEKKDVLSVTVAITNSIRNGGITKGYYIYSFLKSYRNNKPLAVEYVLDYIKGIRPVTIERYRIILSYIKRLS